MEKVNLYGMTEKRYIEIDSGESDSLTEEEVKAGWFFCEDCDGLLANRNDKWLCCQITALNHQTLAS